MPQASVGCSGGDNIQKHGWVGTKIQARSGMSCGEYKEEKPRACNREGHVCVGSGSISF